MWAVVRRAGAGVVVLAAAVVLALNRPVAKAALLIILFSISFAYLVAPLALRVRIRYSRGRAPLSPTLAALFIYLVLFVLGIATWTLAAGKFRSQLSDLRSHLPSYTERARRRLEKVERFADRFTPPEPYAVQIRELSRRTSASIKTRASRVGEEVIASRPLLRWLWLVPVIALVLISRFTRFRDSAVAHLPEGHLRWRGEEFFRHVNCILAGYMRAQVLSCLLVGIVSIAGFWLIGVSHALLLGTVAGILEFLPAVGPLSVALAACSIVSDERLLALVGFLVVLRIGQDYLIYPLLAGHEMHLHPVAIVLAILAGARVGGMLGILAAIPFVGIASIAVRHWREYWQLENVVKEHGRQVNGVSPTNESSPEYAGGPQGAEAAAAPDLLELQGKDNRPPELPSTTL